MAKKTKKASGTALIKKEKDGMSMKVARSLLADGIRKQKGCSAPSKTMRKSGRGR